MLRRDRKRKTMQAQVTKTEKKTRVISGSCYLRGGTSLMRGQGKVEVGRQIKLATTRKMDQSLSITAKTMCETSAEPVPNLALLKRGAPSRQVLIA